MNSWKWGLLNMNRLNRNKRWAFYLLIAVVMSSYPSVASANVFPLEPEHSFASFAIIVKVYDFPVKLSLVLRGWSPIIKAIVVPKWKNEAFTWGNGEFVCTCRVVRESVRVKRELISCPIMEVVTNPDFLCRSFSKIYNSDLNHFFTIEGKWCRINGAYIGSQFGLGSIFTNPRLYYTHSDKASGYSSQNVRRAVLFEISSPRMLYIFCGVIFLLCGGHCWGIAFCQERSIGRFFVYLFIGIGFLSLSVFFSHLAIPF